MVQMQKREFELPSWFVAKTRDDAFSSCFINSIASD
jgi:hypothetical protein